MKERSKSNLLTILILIFELFIYVGLFYLFYSSFGSYLGHWLFEIVTMLVFLFAAGLSGLTIGYLGYHDDVWKIALSYMVFVATLTTFLFTMSSYPLCSEILKVVLYIIGSCTIILLVANYTKKRNLASMDAKLELEIIEQPQNDSIN